MRRCTMVLVLCGCAAKAPPAAEPAAAPVADEASTSPRELEFAYQSGEQPSEAPDGAEPTAASEEPAPLPEPVELSAIAERAVLEALSEYPSVLLTPALPVDWPPQPGVVSYVAYAIEPQGTAIAKWRVGRPIARVSVALADKSARVETLEAKNKKPLGTFENRRASATDPIHAAEASLFAIVAGRGDAEKLRYRLRPYADWLDEYAVVRADLREREPGFIGWVTSDE